MSDGVSMLLILSGFGIAGLLFMIWMDLVQVNAKLDELRRLFRREQDRREEGDEWKDV